MTNFKVAIFFILCLCCGCSHPQNKWVLIKNLSLSHAGLVITESSLTEEGEQKFITLFFTNSEYKLMDGYMDCSIDSINNVDSITQKITGCKDHLYKEGDTIKVYYDYDSKSTLNSAVKTFPRVTLLFKDKLERYYASDTIF